MPYHIAEQASKKLEEVTESRPGLRDGTDQSLLGEIMSIVRAGDPSSQALAESFLRMDEDEIAHFASYMQWLDDLSCYQPRINTRKDLVLPVAREFPLYLENGPGLQPANLGFQNIILGDRVSSPAERAEESLTGPPRSGGLPGRGPEKVRDERPPSITIPFERTSLC